jgi:4-amino-4-deoxy-L-arabinose transferase-like glycosyltransferase
MPAALVGSARRVRAAATVGPVRPLFLATILLTALAAVVRLPWMHARAVFYPAADTPEYLAMARAVHAGTIFPEGSIPRTPGYAYFVALCDLLPGSPLSNVAFVQQALGIALVAAVCLVAASWFGTAVGLCAGGLVAVSPQLFAIEDEVLPDFLVAVLVFAICVLVLRAAAPARRHRRTPWIGLGLLIATAILVKPVVGVLLAAGAVVLLATGAGRRRAVIASGLTVAAAVAGLMPWIVHNAVVHGSPSLGGQLGLTLYNRVFEVDQRPIVPGPTAQSQVAAVEGGRLAAEGLRPHVATLVALQQRFGYDVRTAAGVERRLATAEIRRYPLRFTGRTVTLAGNAGAAAPAQGASARALLPRAGASRTDLARTTWRAAESISSAWWIVALHGWAILGGLLVARGAARRRLLGLATTAALLALVTALTHGGLDRYWYELLPLTIVAATAGAGALLATLVRGATAARA